tara:strand:+ start:4271 stop:5635 length:1365 start_codon:yes stop_codon:yes gene_type:complete
MKPEMYEGINPNYIYTITVIFLFCVSVHFLTGERSNWLRIDLFFILGFAIVHFQWPIMYSFSNILPENYWDIFVDDNLINYTTWLSAVGGVSFLIGYGLFQPKSKKLPRVLNSNYNYNKLLIFTAIVFGLFLLFAGKNFLTGGVYKGEGGSAAGGGISKYFALLFQVSLTLTTGLIIYKNKEKYKGSLIKWFLGFDILYLVIVVVYVVLFLLIGDRGGPLTLILTILLLVGSLVRKFKFYEVFLITLLGGVVMTLIGLGRSEASGLDIFGAGSEKFEVSSGYDTTLELANSVRTVNATVAEVPVKHDYFYGALWVTQLLSPIPFAQSIYMEIMDLEWYEVDSSGYITYLVLGKYPTWGLGTSLIADIYVNFGLIGIIFFMFLLGIFIKRLSIELQNPSNYKWFIMAITVGGVSFYYSRSNYLMSFRDIIWGFLFFKLMVKTRKIGKRKRWLINE